MGLLPALLHNPSTNDTKSKLCQGKKDVDYIDIVCEKDRNRYQRKETNWEP
jgi:hypothetical protein